MLHIPISMNAFLSIKKLMQHTQVRFLYVNYPKPQIVLYFHEVLHTLLYLSKINTAIFYLLQFY